MRYDEVMTNGTPQVEKLVALSVHVLLLFCDVFLVAHVGELTHLRLLCFW